MPIVLGIVTARGGSKGVPRKNIKKLAGKPLIAYTIESAKESGVFSRIIVSTDDKEIAEVGKKYGADVPFLRPAELAEDSTPTLPVLIHAVNWLKDNENFYPDYTVILQPTAPLRRPFHLKEALDLLLRSGADSVVSVSEVPGHFNPNWVFRVEEGRLVPFMPEAIAIKRRQDLPAVYTRNGAIYAFRTDLLFDREPGFYGKDIRAYVMEDRYAVNIDGPEDFIIAELRLRELKHESGK